jgi:transketolase
MALAATLDGRDGKVFVVLGDGECQEGQVWEAAMAAGHHRPPNLIAIVDYNKYQLDGAIADIIDISPLGGKFESFGWRTTEIDGHDIRQVMAALTWARGLSQPACIVANTVKGKGVSFMEHENKYHGVAPTKDELDRALAELDAAEAALNAEGETE